MAEDIVGAANPAAGIALKLAKQDTKKYKAAKKAEGGIKSLIEMLGVVEALSSLVTPITEFFSIFGGVMEAGLGESITRLTESLFTESNVELISKLAELTAKLVNKGLEPLLDKMERWLPILETLIPLIDRFADALDKIDGVSGGALDGLEQIIRFFQRLPRRIEDALEDAVDSVKDSIKDFMEDIFD